MVFENDAFALVGLRLDPWALAQLALTCQNAAVLARQAVILRASDLSLGSEPTCIVCEPAAATNEMPFPEAEYLSRCVGATSEARRRLRDASTAGCACANDCFFQSCSCCATGSAYTTERKLRCLLDDCVDDSSRHQLTVIECSHQCFCDIDRCSNRVVSRGVQEVLIVFRTDGRGWGVRAGAELQRGTFVCEYAGELVSSTEAALRRAQYSCSAKLGNFIMTIVEHPPNGSSLPVLRTHIDPTIRGGVGRYINHSCDPNLCTVVVRTGSFVPSLAFFCRRDIDAGEELTFHYGDASPRASTPSVAATSVDTGTSCAAAMLPIPFAPNEVARRPCQCGTAICEGFLPLDTSAD